ncbi:MAG: ATP-dependent zinc metalloprotease FtsH [Lachnospiraceae bacterium]|nr:ATP-dependent zinc metalloprotease FtsH [Lachnospiraceae bacterium]
MDNQDMDRYDPGNRGNGAGSGSGNGGRGNQQNNNKRPNTWMMALAALCTVLVIFLFYNFFLGGRNVTATKSYTDFISDLEGGRVESVSLDAENAALTVTLTLSAVMEDNSAAGGTAHTGESNLEQYAYYMQLQQERTYVTNVMESMDTLTSRLEAAGVEGARVVSANSSLLTEILIGVVIPVILLWLLASLLMRRMGGGGGPMGVGKSTAKVYVQKDTGVTFKDVAGEDEAKESLVEVVDFLHNPGKYTGIGARLPKGALLVGPPGTGKTLLAKAVAGEAHVPFFSLTGSDFIELYVGVGASRVRDLFKEANKNAPCIIFIDEIDAIGRSRDSKYGGGNEEREQTLNQLLSEMDGFDSSKGILILGATNRPEILDKALLRPGRFDRRIIVDKPDLKGRVEILKVHAKDVKLDESVDLDAIALATSGAVGSDLANMINEAAINAVKEGREYVCQQDLFNAVETVLVGKEKKDRIMSAEERRIVSYHEVGHALISALQKNSEPVQKITIVPRTMGALGYVMHVPEEEKYLNSEAELRDMIVGLLGGRAAEELVFGNVTTGAANDIEKATDIARNMVTRYGMSKRYGLAGFATIESQYLEGRTAMNCSDATAAGIDEEVVSILKESYEKALELLRDNRDVMDKLADFLIEKETITGKEFMAIYRKEKGLPEPEEEAGEKTEEGSAETASEEQHTEAEGASENAGSAPADAAEAGAGAIPSEELKDAGAAKDNAVAENDAAADADTATEPADDDQKGGFPPASYESPEDHRGRFSGSLLD